MAKIDLPRNPINYSDEFKQYENLRLKNTPLTTSGAFSITSASSGLPYSTLTGGEADVMNQLLVVIGDSVVTAEDINKIDNSYALDLVEAYGNVKTADDGQDETLWTSSGTISNDVLNYKIGNKSTRITSTVASGTISTLKENTSLDLSKLNNHEISSDDDYINFVVYVSDVSVVDFFVLYFSQDPTWSITNNKLITINSVDLVTGWNYLKLKKSNFGTNGGGAWSGIQSIRLAWSALSDANGEYISQQLIQLVKKDPLAGYPNPFQKFDVREFAINSGEWFVGEEFGKIALKELSGVGFVTNALQNDLLYDNFTATSGFILDTSSDTGYLTWYVDSDNEISLQINNSQITLNIKENGIATLYQEPISVNIGDKVQLKLVKDGTNVASSAIVNNNIVSIIQLNKQTTISDGGNLSFGTRTLPTYIVSASITEIAHAHHSDIAEVAKYAESARNAKTIDVNLSGDLLKEYAKNFLNFTNTGPITITIQPNSVIPHDLFTDLALKLDGVNTVTFVAGAGVTIDSVDGLLTLGTQYATAALHQTKLNVWTLSGLLE